VSQYFYVDNSGQTTGPLTGSQFAGLINSGTIERSTFCGKDTSPNQTAIELIGETKWNELRPSVPVPQPLPTPHPPKSIHANEIPLSQETKSTKRFSPIYMIAWVILAIIFGIGGQGYYNRSVVLFENSQSVMHETCASLEGLKSVIMLCACAYFISKVISEEIRRNNLFLT